MINPEKMITVVLPTYNGSKYIRNSIDSIIAQTYDNWELIIVNDCSTDNTPVIVADYADKDPRIRVISNEVNKKLPASLNVGFSEARGELLTWTSDDNAYHDDAFRKMVDALNDNEDVDLVYSDFELIDTEGNHTGSVIEPEPEELKINNCVGACFLYRRSIAEKIGQYDTKLFLAEDYEYWLRVFLNGTVVHISDSLYDYRLHEKSLTQTRKIAIQKATFLAREKHFFDLLKRCRDQEEKNRFFDQMLMNLTEKDELKKYRRMYYSMDRNFRTADMKHRTDTVRKNIFTSFKKLVKKVLRIKNN